MRYLKVKLWGGEIGRLVWDSATRRIYFMYNPERNANSLKFSLFQHSIPKICYIFAEKFNTNNLWHDQSKKPQNYLAGMRNALRR